MREGSGKMQMANGCKIICLNLGFRGFNGLMGFFLNRLSNLWFRKMAN
jgi:hypothetical protein